MAYGDKLMKRGAITGAVLGALSGCQGGFQDGGLGGALLGLVLGVIGGGIIAGILCAGVVSFGEYIGLDDGDSQRTSTGMIWIGIFFGIIALILLIKALWGVGKP